MPGPSSAVSGFLRGQVQDGVNDKVIESLGDHTKQPKQEEAVSSSSGFVTNAAGEMAEGIVLAAAWFTVRMICQGSYKAIKTYREDKKEQMNKRPAIEAPDPTYRGWQPSPEHRECDVPWACPADPSPGEEEDYHLKQGDREWLQGLHNAANAKASRDTMRLLEEVQVLGDKIDNLAIDRLYVKLKKAMKLLIEYQQNPIHHSAYLTLLDAAATARELSTDETSLVLNLSALRIRVVITYMHVLGPGKAPEPAAADNAGNKEQCQLFITNALMQHTLQDLCRKFLSSRFSYDKDDCLRVEREVGPAFDIALEVISSVHMLEPFHPSESPVPEGAPFLVMLALSEYCRSGAGASAIYKDLAKGFVEWRSMPERQDRIALYSLYNSTNGGSWSCRAGWELVLENDLSDVFGVTVDGGRVTKINLGANNLEGKLPQEIKNLVHLKELALPNNSLAGVVPEGLWSLKNLRVVALQGNHYTVEPPPRFVAASLQGAEISGYSDPDAALLPKPPQRRRRHLLATVEPLHPERMEVYEREWFTCSWKITNTGGVDFSPHTRLQKAPSVCSGDGATRGVTEIPVNPLKPGEEQTVHAMQQAPGHKTWGHDDWNLVGEGLDFVDDDDAAATSPHLSVVKRFQVDRRVGQTDEARSLANEVFVIHQHSRQPSSFHSLGSIR